ncbi:extensin-like [Drosophila eugracilis]|uniref:extensin-like n=1 Tax=Drosophila eugracilis TaxID=29029 RepID=UPI0007E756A2|nr:extensin-like [Drosophila eugracilis]
MLIKILGLLLLLTGQSLGDLRHLDLQLLGQQISGALSRPGHSSGHNNNNAQSDYNAYLNEYYNIQWQQFYQAQAAYDQLYGPYSLYGLYSPYGPGPYNPYGYHGQGPPPPLPGPYNPYGYYGQGPPPPPPPTTTAAPVTTTPTPTTSTAIPTTTGPVTTSTAIPTSTGPQTTSTALATQSTTTVSPTTSTAIPTSTGPDTTSTALASSNAVARYQIQHTTPIPYPYDPNPLISPFDLRRIHPQRAYVHDPALESLAVHRSPAYIPYNQIQFVAKK